MNNTPLNSIDGHGSNEAKRNTSLQELHKLFIKYKLHGAYNSQKTIKNYRDNFKLLLQFNPKITLKDLTENTILRFLEFLNTRKRKVGKKNIVRYYKNSSMATVRSKLNAFFDWLAKRDYIKANPFKDIPYPKVSYTDRRAFTSKEFKAICHAVNVKISWANLLIKKRNIAIVMFMTFTGVRKEELLGLQLSDVDIQKLLVTVRAETSKSKRTRIIPISTLLIPYLEDYFAYRKDYTTSSLWVSSTKDRGFTEHGAKYFFNLLTKATKINCYMHRFRHTFATNYYLQTHDLIGLKELMGHRSLKMTLSYLRSLPNEHTVEQIRKISLDEFV